MSVTYVRNATTGEFEQVGPGGATTDTTLSQSGKPADAAAVGAALSLYALQTSLPTYEEWTFTLEDDSTVTKNVAVMA